MSDKASNWWAQSRSRAQATAAAFVALVVVLGGLSAFVWNSPSNAPVRHAFSQAVESVNPLASENAKLQRSLVAAQSQLVTQKAKVAALQAKSLADKSSNARQLAQALRRANMAEASLKSVKAAAAVAAGYSSSPQNGGNPVSGGSAGATRPRRSPPPPRHSWSRLRPDTSGCTPSRRRSTGPPSMRPVRRSAFSPASSGTSAAGMRRSVRMR